MQPETITRFLFVCKTRTCQQLYPTDIDTADWDGDNPDCPVCGEELTTVDKPEVYETCLAVDCTQFLSAAGGRTDDRCEGKRGTKKGECKLTFVQLSDDELDDLPDTLLPDEEDDVTPDGPARRLRAAIVRANKWVKGSGSHHRSKGGSHTSSAREKHSAASGSKARVRETMAESLQELIDAAKSAKADKSLIKDGENAKKAVLNK